MASASDRRRWQGQEAALTREREATTRTTRGATITGVSHIDLTVADLERSKAFYAELEAWRDRLAERGIEHSPIVNGDLWDVLVFRDPEGIQLELFFMRPEAAALLAG